MSKNNAANPYLKKPVAEVAATTDAPPEVEQPKIRTEVRTSRVRMVSVEMPIAEEFNGNPSRHVNTTITPRAARLLARLRTGLVADGATVNRSGVRLRHVANTSDVLAWLVERIAEGVAEEDAASPP